MKKIIFVTGASSGIGKALSIRFANSGWKVIASARRLDLLKKLSKESNNLNAIIPIKMDISNKKIVSSQVDKTIKKYGIPVNPFFHAVKNFKFFFHGNLSNFFE